MSRSLLDTLAANKRHLVLVRGDQPPIAVTTPYPDGIAFFINQNALDVLIESGQLPKSALPEDVEPALTHQA